MSSEKQIEQEIQDKGLNAPRLTPDHIDNLILSKHFINAGEAVGVIYSETLPQAYLKSDALDTLTFCILVLKNGFTVTGESACASPENFNKEIGEKISYENARNKIWQLEGYLLKEKLFQENLDSKF